MPRIGGRASREKGRCRSPEQIRLPIVAVTPRCAPRGNKLIRHMPRRALIFLATERFMPRGEDGIRHAFLQPYIKDKFRMAFEKLETLIAAELSSEDSVDSHCATGGSLRHDRPAVVSVLATQSGVACATAFARPCQKSADPKRDRVIAAFVNPAANCLRIAQNRCFGFRFQGAVGRNPHGCDPVGVFAAGIVTEKQALVAAFCHCVRRITGRRRVAQRPLQCARVMFQSDYASLASTHSGLWIRLHAQAPSGCAAG